MFNKLVNTVKSDRTSKGKYCPIRVNGVYTRALIDSGNLAGNCISFRFAKKIGLDKDDLVQVRDSLGTAKKGARLTVHGKPRKPIEVKFGGLNQVFKTRPYVIDELTSDINISLGFLEKHKIDQIHSKHSLKINGKLVRMYDSRGILKTCDKIDKKKVAKQETADCYVEQDAEIPPNSMKFIKVRVPRIQSGHMENGSGILEPGELFITRNDLHPCKEAAVTVKKDGTTFTSVLNTLDIPIKVHKDQTFGTFTKYMWKQSQRKNKKLDWPDEKIVSEFKLDKSPVLKTKADLRKAIFFIKQYGGLFSEYEGDFGETDLIQHDIETGQNQPVKQKARPMNPPQAKDFEKQLRIWLDSDIVEEASSPWNSRLLAVPKKDGKTRYVVDYRMVNLATKKDAYPLPNIDESLARMGHAKIFSTMDGSGAYHVVRINPEHKEKTAFSCEFGQFQFKRLPFGLCNAPSTYARLLQKVLHGLERKYVANYLDDTCVFTHDLDEHFRQLKKVFDAHREAGIKLAPKKCNFFQEETEFLGHVVSKDGIKTNPKNTEVIANWTIETLEDVHTFVGKCVYYSNFIHDFARKIAPLQNLLTKENMKSKKKKMLLTKEEMEAVYQMKKALTESPVLAYPDFESKEPFILDTDWSHDPGAIGGVLSQKQNGMEKVIAYGARKLRASEKNYSSNKGELLAVIYFMEKWKFYLSAKPFILRTDHQALRWLFSMEVPTAMTCRWMQMLCDRNFTIEFRRGKDHGNADALSRQRIIHEMDDLNDLMASKRIESVEVMTRSEAAKTNDCDFNAAMEKDSVLQEVHKWFDSGRPARKHYRSKGPEILYYFDMFSCLKRRGNKIYLKWKSISGADIERLCIPRDKQMEIITEVHELGHIGINNTIETVKSRYAFPGIAAKVEMVVKNCLSCQKRMDKKKQQKHTLISTTDGAPFQRLSIDIVVMKKSTKGNRYLLTAKCCFTKWLEAIPMPDQTAETVGTALFNHVFSRHGMAQQCHSDMGRQFMDKVFQSMCDKFKILKTTTPAYNPKSNPVERSHRHLKACLKALEGTEGDWEDHLPAALLAIRTSVHKATGMTPFMALYGREANLPIDIAYGSPPGEETTERIETWAEVLQDRMRKLYEHIRNNTEDAVRRSASYYTQGSIAKFKPGDKVWLYTPRIDKEKGAKLTNPWSGPYLVQQKKSEVLFQILALGNWNKQGTIASLVTVDRLMKYTQPWEHNTNDNLSADDITLPLSQEQQRTMNNNEENDNETNNREEMDSYRKQHNNNETYQRPIPTTSMEPATSIPEATWTPAPTPVFETRRSSTIPAPTPTPTLIRSPIKLNNRQDPRTNVTTRTMIRPTPVRPGLTRTSPKKKRTNKKSPTRPLTTSGTLPSSTTHATTVQTEEDDRTKKGEDAEKGQREQIYEELRQQTRQKEQPETMPNTTDEENEQGPTPPALASQRPIPPALPPPNQIRTPQSTDEEMEQTPAPPQQPRLERSTHPMTTRAVQKFNNAKAAYGKILRRSMRRSQPYDKIEKEEQLKQQNQELRRKIQTEKQQRKWEEEKRKEEEKKRKQEEKVRQKMWEEEEIKYDEEMRRREKIKRAEQREWDEDLKRRQEEEKRQMRMYLKKKQQQEDANIKFEMREKAKKRIYGTSSSEEEKKQPQKQQRNMARPTDFDTAGLSKDKLIRPCFSEPDELTNRLRKIRQRAGAKSEEESKQHAQQRKIQFHKDLSRQALKQGNPKEADRTQKTAQEMTQAFSQDGKARARPINTSAGPSRASFSNNSSEEQHRPLSSGDEVLQSEDSLPSYHSSQQELPEDHQTTRKATVKPARLRSQSRPRTALTHPISSSDETTDSLRSRSTRDNRSSSSDNRIDIDPSSEEYIDVDSGDI